MTASNCTIGWLLAQQFCSVNVSDSSIGTAESEAYSVNCSIIMLKPGFFNYWNYRDNCSIKLSLEGNAPDVALSECQIERWSFEFQGASNISISDSLLYHPFLRHLSVAALSDSIFTSIYTHDSSINGLVNSTATHYYHYGESCTNVYWYLDVHVVDSIDQAVPFANVNATYANTTVAEWRLTDANGWARLTLMEKMMNATGEYPVGNYTVEATYDIYSDQTTANMTENQQITLTLADFVIPEFRSFLILPLFIITTLLAVIVYRRKHST
jgi:hypothetical protein